MNLSLRQRKVLSPIHVMHNPLASAEENLLYYWENVSTREIMDLCNEFTKIARPTKSELIGEQSRQFVLRNRSGN